MVATTLFVSSLLAGSALAAALPGSGPVEIQQVARTNSKKFNLARSIYRAHIKYGKEAPDSVKAAYSSAKASGALDKRVTGSAVTTPEPQDVSYLTPVSIGTPAQVLNLDFDTGSSDLWVFSSLQSASQRAGHSYFTSTASSTFKTLSGYTWSISYGDGSSSSGTVGTDSVTIGGVTVTAQAVELAKTVSSEFVSDVDNDGLVGLAFDNINTVSPTPQKTFLTNALPQLTAPVLTADLKAGKPGTYGLGLVDSTKYTGAVTYTAISTAQGFWEWKSTGYAVGSKAFVSTTIDGIADTGTTLLYLPTAVVKAYYSGIAGAQNSANLGGWVFSCSAAASLPTFTYGVGTGRIVIPGSYFNFGQAATGSSSCFGGLQDSASIGISIFGDVALKAAYVVFDKSVPRIGFASKAL